MVELPAVEDVLKKERAAHLDDIHGNQNFNQRIQRVKQDALIYLIQEKNVGKRITSFGEAAKGNTD